MPTVPPTATETSRAIAQGALTATDVAEATLQLIEALEPEVQAFAWLSPEKILERAAELDAQPDKGPLAGVTVGVKDVIDTIDMPTGQNNARHEGRMIGRDAACVETLRLAGAIIAGKTVTTEFAATQRGGKTRNPHDLTRTPGGSSSGSAAAVAAGMCAVALGTQTGGSTIRPASYNGVWGWKPTWNVISREGLKVYSLTCDTLGLYARAAEDLDLLADVFDLDPAPRPESLKGLRIGLCRSPTWDRTEQQMRAAFEDAAKRLRLEGAEIIDVTLPSAFDGLEDAHAKILMREGRTAFLNEVRAAPDTIHAEFRSMVDNHNQITPVQMRAAYSLADDCRASIDEILTGLDAIMTPSATGEAPLGLESTGDPSMNSMWTLLQLPVVSAPGLCSPSGLPLGISFVTRRYADRTAIQVARLAGEVFALESAFA